MGLTVVFGFLMLSLPSRVAGQAVNATLLGTVTDASGAAVANAKVTITETNTGISHTSQTNESGNYVFPDLPPGTYTVFFNDQTCVGGLPNLAPQWYDNQPTQATATTITVTTGHTT